MDRGLFRSIANKVTNVRWFLPEFIICAKKEHAPSRLNFGEMMKTHWISIVRSDLKWSIVILLITGNWNEISDRGSWFHRSKTFPQFNGTWRKGHYPVAHTQSDLARR